jgi:amino acid transporter
VFQSQSFGKSNISFSNKVLWQKFHPLSNYKSLHTILNSRFLLILFTFFLAFPALADGPVIPMEAVIFSIVLVVLGGFALSMLLAFLVKLVLQKVRHEKRNKIWIMSLTTFLAAALFWYWEEEYDWMYYSNVEIDYGYETRVRLYNVLFVFSALLGSVLGYFFTPKKK